MTFYSDLRDDTAGPLIAQFGQDGVYRTFGSESYDNASGKTSKGAPTDTPIKLLDLPMKMREFSDEVAALATGMFLLSAKEFAAASVIPAVTELVVVGGKDYRILAINSVGPASEVVIYKMAVSYNA